MKRFLLSAPLWQNWGLFVVRLIFAFFLIYHGYEVFDNKLMKGYTEWDVFKTNTWLPYFGKATELLAGFLLLLGFLTRISCLIVIATFTYITFFVGSGKFWYDDQHPFMFILLALMFIFTGPGAGALDSVVFKKK
jgi:putative oxidoreductase